MRRRQAFAAAVLIALVLVGAASGASAPAGAALQAGTTVVVDRPQTGPLLFDGVAASTMWRHAISADGCFVVFSSASSLLRPVPSATAASEVYRLNRCSGAPGGTLQVVSATAAGVPADSGYSEDASISADGRYVAFSSTSPALAGLGASAILRKDMDTGAVVLAGRADGPAGAQVDAYSPSISGDGGSVVFVASGPVHAVNGDGATGKTDVYVRGIGASRTELVSVAANGQPGGGAEDGVPDIDYSGQQVAFDTSASLLGTDVGDAEDVYLRQGVGTASATTQLVSFSGGGQTQGADAGAGQLALSTDGTRVAWALRQGAVFVAACAPTCPVAARVDRDFSTGAFAGGDNRGVFFPRAMSGTSPATPTRVFWITVARLRPEDTNQNYDVYSHDITDATGGSTNVWTAPTVDGDVDAADDVVVPDVPKSRSYLPFATSNSTNLPGADGYLSQVYMGPGTSPVSLSNPSGRKDDIYNSLIGRHAVSDDGRAVAFIAQAPGLGSPGTAFEAFVRDTATGAVRMISRASGGAAADGSVNAVSLDAAGDRAVFTSTASNLDGPSGGYDHVYVVDLATGAVHRLDNKVDGSPASGHVQQPVISADGRFAAYYDAANDLAGAAGDNQYHVYRVDLASGATTLVDRTAGGTPADASASDLDISGDGSVVAFSSPATNLATVPAGVTDAVFVADLHTRAVTFASVTSPGVFPYAFSPQLSRDGTKVAFTASASGGSGAFVRDLAARTTTEASVGTGTAPAYGFTADSISADGARVAFHDVFGNPAAGWLRDLGAGTTRRVDLTPSGAPSRAGVATVILDGSGRCAALGSVTDDLTSPAYSQAFQHVYLHAIDDCPAVPGGAGGSGGGGAPGGGTAGGVGATNGAGGIARPDKTVPVVSALRLTHRRFALATGRTALTAAARRRAPRGTAFTFRLSEKARVTFAIASKRSGRRSKGRCVPPKRKLHTRCTRLLLKGTLTRKDVPGGKVRVAFTGRLGAKGLATGAYRATLIARDAAGNASTPRTIDFTIVRR